ncbi:hypothetical protein Taro_002004 [Colocasia esculenta]|uniref:Uncharacterized protein n=1 Tax=Colocasia esculenta TaxID=4460 RepID=A0A843THI2_COLES|nr:hypothetical protein [Colocasia esculenta]
MNNEASWPMQQPDAWPRAQHLDRKGSRRLAKSRPGRTSPERSPTKRHTSNHRGNTTVARNEHKALLGRTSTRSEKRRSWEEPSPECTNQRPNNTDHQREYYSKQNCRSNASRSWENLYQNHQGTALGKLARTHQPNQQHTSDYEVAQKQQKRARNSPERNPHQDNNKRFWETSPEHRATKRCTSA